ncbi:MAG: hypothetical protein H6R02_148 [Burkholderiaceae bacterium]|nr:hypothetical protein [Burkholderiaceae bacterium]
MRHLEAPVSAQQRIVTLDIVRGFALLGILIMNMPGFVSSIFIEADGSHLWSSPIDRAAELARDMLFSGKFNSMFSLLFGIGFTIQFARMEQLAPGHATHLYLRRLLILLAIGLVHAMFFWTGDVLHVYAVLGLLLLLVMRHMSDRAIVALIVLLLVYPAISGVVRLLVVTPDITAMRVAQAQAFEASNNLAYGGGTFIAAAREHMREFAHFYDNVWSLWGTLGFYVQMATTMLLGVLVGRHRLAQRIPELLPSIRRIQGWALSVGLVCALTFGIIFEIQRTPGPTPLKVLGSLAYTISRPSLMIFYVLTIVRLAQLPSWQARFAPIAATGRMPLTNYLMQTLICTTLMYGWGFGLWGTVGPAGQLLLAFASFFVIQVPLSILWLRRFEYGPLEYLWRVATYGRMRFKPAGVPAST